MSQISTSLWQSNLPKCRDLCSVVLWESHMGLSIFGPRLRIQHWSNSKLYWISSIRWNQNGTYSHRFSWFCNKKLPPPLFITTLISEPVRVLVTIKKISSVSKSLLMHRNRNKYEYFPTKSAFFMLRQAYFWVSKESVRKSFQNLKAKMWIGRNWQNFDAVADQGNQHLQNQSRFQCKI